MQVRLLLLFLLVLIASKKGWAQLFQNRNLYDIWITADRYVDEGKFDAAIKLYEAAPQVPEFARQLTLTQRLKTVFQDGERLYRAKKYAEALETFSQYRTIAPDLHAAILDKRIQACLQQLDKVVVNKLAQSTRVVAGFEYAYKGDKKLMELDTLAALSHYTKARQLGAGLNPTLREQYTEGLRWVKALRSWGDEYRRTTATNDKGRTLEVLRGYRSASKYILSGLEYEIKSAEEGEKAFLATTSQGKPGERMIHYALDCRTDDLAYFIKSNYRIIPQAAKLSQTLADYQAIERDIAWLTKNEGNPDFLESAYRNLITKAVEIPGVSEAMQRCAKKRYFDYLVEQARLSEETGIATGENNDYREALRYVMEAYQVGVPPLELDELRRRLTTQLDCEDRRKDFEQQVGQIRAELSNCRMKSAKEHWDAAANRLAGCGLDEARFAQTYLALRDSVVQFYTADSLLTDLTSRLNQKLTDRHCGEARQLIGQLDSLSPCNPAYRDSVLVEYRARITKCEQGTCYTTARAKAFQSAENREWKKSFDLYQQAYACAPDEQRVKIKEILTDMECDAYPERCHRGNVSTSLEPTVRVGANKPSYIENGLDTETTYGYLLSGGLQLSFLSYRSPVDVVLGLEYFQTEYQSLKKGYSAGDFKISGADAYVAFKLHQTGTNPDRLRPYLKGGLEVLLPMRYSLQNHHNNESTRDRSLLKKQSLGALAGLGVELQRKKFGFFVELVGSYNFSGIYNANAISSSGAREKTEAHFRTFGIRMGTRLW